MDPRAGEQASTEEKVCRGETSVSNTEHVTFATVKVKHEVEHTGNVSEADIPVLVTQLVDTYEVCVSWTIKNSVSWKVSGPLVTVTY